MKIVNDCIKRGAQAFIGELAAGGTKVTAGEADVITLGCYVGATTVLGMLEDLLLSSEPSTDKLAQIQALIEEARDFAVERVEQLDRMKQDAAALATMSPAPSDGS